MPLWIAITASAALFQCWRTAMQQKLRGLLSVNAAGWCAICTACRSASCCGCLPVDTGLPLPSPNCAFLFYCAAGGLLQILGTNLLIMAFGYRDFAVGTAYSKTETVQSAILALIVLASVSAPLPGSASRSASSGVMTLSLAGRGCSRRNCARDGAAGGAVRARRRVRLRADHRLHQARQQGAERAEPVRARAVVAGRHQQAADPDAGRLPCWREPGEVRKAFTTWRSPAHRSGTLSACGSACWFTAFALAPVALVRAVGQVEIVFTLLFSRFYLRERPSRSEVIGALTVVAGVVIVLVGR